MLGVGKLLISVLVLLSSVVFIFICLGLWGLIIVFLMVEVLVSSLCNELLFLSNDLFNVVNISCFMICEVIRS